ncbi:MAG TPA: 3-hydroxyacyl-ACP dehydratase FabZ [Terriglobia bacterium]|nr:3-hydroxyacyl-ACP dehydratase FabZ [Terriglobia bacterium]
MVEPTPESRQLLVADIERTLPHRYPFLFVDRITEFVPGERIAAIKHFSAGDQAGQGHFPEAPVVPAGIVLEMVTQLGAVLVLERPEMKDKVAVILNIPMARMIEPVQPGDTLRVEARVVRLRESVGELKGMAYRDGTLVAEGQVRFAIANASDLLPAGRPLTP